MKIELRRAVPDDQEFLWQMLYYAAHMDEGGEAPESARSNPALAPYVEGFGQADDVGVIAIDTVSDERVGAAWIRPMPAAWPLYEVVEPGTPELAIAVTPLYIGRGVGGWMIARLLDDAVAYHRAIMLSVRANNPAKGLYERHGFRVVAEITNRVGSKSLIMKIELGGAR
jgi:ribosomal protein S18 acetylase RimI-like enzyme